MLDRWSEYERQKKEWIAEHPAFTADEYESAIKAIAERLKV